MGNNHLLPYMESMHAHDIDGRCTTPLENNKGGAEEEKGSVRCRLTAAKNERAGKCTLDVTGPDKCTGVAPTQLGYCKKRSLTITETSSALAMLIKCHHARILYLSNDR